ncbi:MAG: chorismate mutase [Acidobacteriota bacterium]|nr:chorismate mutase [Acidobacteriota bacterium]
MSDSSPKPPADEHRAAAEEAIERIRENIDQVDTVLVKLLNQRAQWALEIGDAKKDVGIAIYQPGREKKVLGAVQDKNQGPMGHDALQRLWERIMDESRRLERVGDGADEGGEQE